MADLEPLTPGIYFGLPEERYFADSAISRSDIMNLLDTPNTYWANSWMNKAKKPRDSTAQMDYGSAFDCLLFEPEIFQLKYEVIGGGEWGTGKEKIAYKDYMAMIDSIRVLREGKNSSLFLSGGVPQVVIVYEENGLLFRTRHDYFTPVVSNDFKTAWSLTEHHIQKAFAIYGYDIQLNRYKRSRRRFKEQFRRGEAEIYGAVSDKFFNDFMESSLDEFMFIFQRKTAPYPYEILRADEGTDESGEDKTRKAVEIYNFNLKKYGTSEWPVCEGKLKDFSMFYGIRGENE